MVMAIIIVVSQPKHKLKYQQNQPRFFPSKKPSQSLASVPSKVSYYKLTGLPLSEPSKEPSGETSSVISSSPIVSVFAAPSLEPISSLSLYPSMFPSTLPLNNPELSNIMFPSTLPYNSPETSKSMIPYATPDFFLT